MQSVLTYRAMKYYKTAFTLLLIALIFNPSVNADEIFGDWRRTVKKDTMTDEVKHIIGTSSLEENAFLYISMEPMRDNIPGITGKNFVFLLNVKEDVLDNQEPIFRIDKNEPVRMWNFSPKKSLHSWMWSAEYSNDADLIQNKNLLNPMKKSTKIRFRYYTWPEGVKEVIFSLNGFTEAFDWLVSAHPGL